MKKGFELKEINNKIYDLAINYIEATKIIHSEIEIKSFHQFIDFTLGAAFIPLCMILSKSIEICPNKIVAHTLKEKYAEMLHKFIEEIINPKIEEHFNEDEKDN